MTKTITFNELRRIKDSLPDGSMHRIADELNVTTQTVRNYFGGSNYSFGKNCGLHIEPGPDGGIVVLDNTQIYDMAIRILEEENKATEDSKDETGNTTTPSSDSESTSGVKTGDAVNMYVYIMIALLAVLTAACTVPYVRKNRK